MTTSDPLLRPFELGPLTVRNRIFSSAHIASLVVDGMPAKAYQAYHEEKARGGLGLTIFGGSSVVSVDSPGFFAQVDVSQDRVIPHLEAFSRRVHRHGAAIMCQITHLGRRTWYDQEPWLPIIAPSAVREPAHRAFPKAMDSHDIERVTRDFAAAARRCRDGGLDGCEVVAYAHLLGQFLSPATNRRTDEWGGSLDNRMRFPLAVLEAIRTAVGADFVVGVRLYGDERRADGLDRDACIEIARRFASSGLVDFLDVVANDLSTDAGLADFMPGMSHPLALYLPVAAAVKAAVDIPVLHATRIADLATARHAVAEGLVDLVGMTRAHIADPHLVGKLARGEEARIRPCVGATYCSDNRNNGVRCLHNAATGREATMPHEIPPSTGPRRRVVIAGAGPAGLEAARVAALRGHDVVLMEAADRPGGQLRLAARASWRGDLVGIVDWLAAEVTRLGVDLRCHCYAAADAVLAESPDVAIVATGGIPDTGIVEGADLVLDTWEVLRGEAGFPGRALVFDDHGEHQAVSCASYLAERGAEVELVTPERAAMAASMRAMNFTAHLRKLYGLGVRITPDHRLVSVERYGNGLKAVLRNEYTRATEERHVDRVVIEHGTLPVDELFHALEMHALNRGVTDVEALAAGRAQDLVLDPRGRFRLFRIGDAVASRNVHAAVYDALRLCKDL